MILEIYWAYIKFLLNLKLDQYRFHYDILVIILMLWVNFLFYTRYFLKIYSVMFVYRLITMLFLSLFWLNLNFPYIHKLQLYLIKHFIVINSFELLYFNFLMPFGMNHFPVKLSLYFNKWLLIYYQFLKPFDKILMIYFNFSFLINCSY